MGRLQRLAALPRAEIGALVAAVPVVLGFRLWLRVSSTRAVAHQPRPDAPARGGPASRDRLLRAVRRASRLVPDATCLTQALAARWLLARAGIGTRLRIGVAKNPDGTLRAHAWLEDDQYILIGGDGVEEFTPLPDAKGARR